MRRPSSGGKDNSTRVYKEGMKRVNFSRQKTKATYGSAGGGKRAFYVTPDLS